MSKVQRPIDPRDFTGFQDGVKSSRLFRKRYGSVENTAGRSISNWDRFFLIKVLVFHFQAPIGKVAVMRRLVE